MFLSHNWGNDAAGRDNHERVKKVAEALILQGFTVWLDHFEMIGCVMDSMIQGINNSELFVVFVTSKYQEKVNQSDLRDNCKFEFSYAFKTLRIQKFIPVVMEDVMMNTRTWTHTLQACIGGLLYSNISFDDPVEFRRGVDDLASKARCLLPPGTI